MVVFDKFPGVGEDRGEGDGLGDADKGYGESIYILIKIYGYASVCV